jgi:hypothetical protein
MLRFQQYQRLQQGRYQVALSLHEAESVRGIMHMHTNQPLIPLTSTAIALRVNAPGMILDQSSSWLPAGEYQQTLEQQAYRFLDNDMFFTDRQVNMLVRALQPNPCEDREIWWSEIRQCRLRQITDWKLSPMKTIFTVQDEYYLLQYRAFIARMRGIIKERKMGLLDAFRLFNSARTGVLSYEEVYGGITWLGLDQDCTGKQCEEICLNMDHDRDGAITYGDFVRHLRDLNEELELEMEAEDKKDQAQQANADLLWLGLDFNTAATSTIIAPSVNNAWMELIAGDKGTEHHAEWREKFGDVKPRVLFPEKIKSAGSLEAEARDLKTKIYKAAEKIRIEVVKVGGYNAIWDSKGSMSRTKVSTWSGRLLANKNYRASVCLGHYATAGFSKPDSKNFYLTVTDSSSILGWFKSRSCYLILNALCPHPIKYKQVWMSRGGEKSLYAWEATPPSKDFVCLGHLFTTTPEEPALSEVRCVPRGWCVPAIVEPKCVWDDAGGGGRRGAIWVINSLSMVYVQEGHEKPKGKEFWDLNSNKFMATHNLDRIQWGDEAGGKKGSTSSGAADNSAWKNSLDSWMEEWGQWRNACACL